MRFAASIFGVVIFPILAVSSVAQEAAPPATPEGYVTGWHIVRPDDTLEDITLQYLGTPRLWEENWRLNSFVENPDLIYPGQRLRVILKIGAAVPTAQLSRLAGRVQERPVPIPWRDANERDILLERDGVQTHEKSSTELEFQDGTRVTLTENSVVFVRRAGIELLGQDRKTVEILEGQADIQAQLDAGSLAEVEVVVAGAVATAKAGSEGNTQSRARRTGSESSAFMVYEGAGEVSSAGESVPLAAGTGTAVTEGAPPAPPEALLPAPSVAAPLDGARIEFGRPRFEWAAVEGAESYVLDVCRDPGCGELVERQVGLEETSWEPESFATGELYWRVAAVSASGLDGFSSPPARFTSLGRIEATPPEVELALTGRKIRVGDRLIADRDFRIDVTVEDAGSGPDRFETYLNDERVANSVLAGNWRDGAYRLKIAGYDAAGNVTFKTLDFEIDTLPPVTSWRRLGEATLAKLGKGLRKAAGDYRLEWSVDGIGWRRLAPKGSLGAGAQRNEPFALNAATVRSDHPFVALRAIADDALGETAPVALSEGEVLLVSAADQRSGTATLELRVDESAVEGPRLWIVATDNLGNQDVMLWPLGD